MYYFCTYFDSNYLSRALALHHSLSTHITDFRLWALCMDSIAFRAIRILNLPGLIPISLDEFEKNDVELLKAKTNRSTVEYYFTCTPSLPLYIINNNNDVDIITYLDADLFFFSNPSALYQETGNNSIAIIEHRFPENLKYHEDKGIFNVSWISFRRDHSGISCLQDWRQQCLEWCYDRVENSRYADQKYLDAWPRKYQDLVILQHPGADLAPWNFRNYEIIRKNRTLLVDGKPLIFYHFQGLFQTQPWMFHTGFRLYKDKPPKILRQSIYKPYVRKLIEYQNRLSDLNVNLSASKARFLGQVNHSSLNNKFGVRIRNYLEGEYIFVLDEKFIVY